MRILWAVFFLTWSMWGHQVSRLSKVTPDNELCKPIGLVPRRLLLVGAGWDAIRHARILSRCSYRSINDNSPVAQPLLKVVEVWLQVPYEQRRLEGRRYDGRVIRVKGQLDVVRGYVIDIQTGEDRRDQSSLNHTKPKASSRWRCPPG